MKPLLNQKALDALTKVCAEYGTNPDVLAHWCHLIPALVSDLTFYKSRYEQEDDTCVTSSSA